ncbi:acyltransferase [Pseudomonas sp. SCB32]|uniref:acyltransferase family protein n=1 Tax=Pseudomonas sp. SCB32 TaxID=2653853 RepID=UPI0012657AAF|nr:acyltransferase [Pseudomonas sp. SCB32]
MLGIFRFILALMVVLAHISEQKPFLHFGVFAVFGFYIVSGYLMTLVLCETYSFKFAPFAINRALRLYPVYFLTAILAFTAIYITPAPDKFHPAWYMWSRPQDFLGNIFIFPFEFYDAYFRVIPPAWSVAVELVCYFLLWAFVARSKATAVATLLAATTYHIYSLISGMDWQSRYFPFYAALLPFSVGACTYHFRSLSRLLPTKREKLFTALTIAWVVNLVTCGFLSSFEDKKFNIFFYSNFALLGALIFTLVNSTTVKTFKRSGKILGDLAYPVFLTHWPVAFVISSVVLEGQRRGFDLFWAALLPCIAISFLLSKAADSWIEPLRNSVRSRSVRASPDQNAPAQNAT